VAASVSIIAVIRPSPVFSVSLPIGSVIAQHWRYGRWAVLTSFVYGVSAYGYYFIAGAALHIHDVGALKALQNLVLPVSQINSAMSLLMLPWASRELASFRSAGFNKAIRKINLLFLSVGLGYTACICLFANWLMSFLYGGRYLRFRL
jgi:O-antigen/teichoic acid export membrane protein